MCGENHFVFQINIVNVCWCTHADTKEDKREPSTVRKIVSRHMNLDCR